MFAAARAGPDGQETPTLAGAGQGLLRKPRSKSRLAKGLDPVAEETNYHADHEQVSEDMLATFKPAHMEAAPATNRPLGG